MTGGVGGVQTLSFFFLITDFYFFHYSWLTVFCQYSTVQQSDPVTRTYIYVYVCIYIYTHTHSSSHIILHHAPSQVISSSQSHYLSIPNATP